MNITMIRLVATLLICMVLFGPVQAQQADEQLTRVIEELQAGRTDKAIEVLKEIIDKNPKHVDAYFFRCTLRLQTGDTQGAMADIDKVIALRPQMGVAYNQRALIRMAKQDWTGALTDLDSAIANNYQNDNVYNIRAQLRQQQGDNRGALSDFDESIKLNPNNPRLYVGRAYALIALEERDRALSDLNYLINWYETDPVKKRPAPKPPEQKLNPAGTDTEKQKSAPSFTIGVEEQTVNEAPGDKEMVPVIASAYDNRGLIHSFKGNHAAAIADFTKSIQLEPTKVWTHFKRADEFESTGDLQRALADVNRAIELEPKNGALRVERGVILSLMGKGQEAQVEFDLLLNADRAYWQKRIDERMVTVKKKVERPRN